MKIALTFSRYLVRLQLFWTAVVSLVMLSVIGLFDGLEIFRRSLNKAEITMPILLKMFIFRLPTHFNELFPFVFLFSGIVVFWRLNRFSELTVMRTSGFSIWQILTPLTGVALAIGLFNITLINPIAANLHSRFVDLENRFLYERSADKLEILESGIWLKEKTFAIQRIIHFGRFDFKGLKAEKIQIFTFDSQNAFLSRIEAATGTFKSNNLHLNDVWYVPAGSAPQKNSQLDIITSLKPKGFSDIMTDPRAVPFWDLPHYAQIMERSGLSGHRYLMYWNTLLASCIWFGAMIVLAATFCLRPIRQGQTAFMIVVGLVTSFVLYFFRDITAALGYAGTIPVLLGAWAPTLVTLLFSITKLLYSEDG